MDPKIVQTAETIKTALPKVKGPLTCADVSAKSALSLRDAEVGLQYLVSEYRGHLSVTDKGEIIYLFPTGFSKPWEKIEGLALFWSKAKSMFLAAAKFIVRAWISIVMIAYVAIFALILIGLMFGKKSDDDERSDNGGGFAFAILMRLLADSLFWTFHPLSPYSAGYPTSSYSRSRKNDVPFYEKVNRYFFGPEAPPHDPQAMTKKLLALIRAKRGRIGVSDVIKVTGLSQQQTDPVLSKLMLNYDGEVNVSDSGSIIYTFREIRKTVENTYVPEPAPIWSSREKVKPLTGNTGSINLLITALNGFNLVMSTFMISQQATLVRLSFVSSGSARMLLGYIPFAFSLFLFSFPVARWFGKSREKQRVDRENGRRGFLFAVFNRMTSRGVSEDAIKKCWEQVSGGSQVTDKILVKEVALLGGEVEVDDQGKMVYRFKQLEGELLTLKEEREQASESEKNVGAVVYSTAQNLGP